MPLQLPLAAKLALATAKFGKFVIERWSAYRRDQFFLALLENLQIEQASGVKRKEVDEALDDLLANDQNSELLFDAYRRVCFSKTKRYGPRIIGLLTAELIIDAMTSGEDEEMIFAAAELLGDVEFADFHREYQKLLGARNVVISGDGEMTETVNQEHYEVGTDRECILTPLDLRTSHGPWAALLESCGLLTTSVTQQTQHEREDSERHIDYDHSWTITTTSVSYRAATKKLFDLLERAREKSA